MSNGRNETVKDVERIPMPWAVVITVLIALLLGQLLGNWNFTNWVAFIVWTEYFIFGAKASEAKIIFPCIPVGAGLALAWCVTALFIDSLLPPAIGDQGFWGLWISTVIYLSLLIYMQSWFPILSKGTLAYFNGLTMYLAVYFSGSFPDFGPLDNSYWVCLWAFAWTVAMCYVGWFYGWLNVALTFPKQVKVQE